MFQKRLLRPQIRWSSQASSHSPNNNTINNNVINNNNTTTHSTTNTSEPTRNHIWFRKGFADKTSDAASLWNAIDNGNLAQIHYLIGICL